MHNYKGQIHTFKVLPEWSKELKDAGWEPVKGGIYQRVDKIPPTLWNKIVSLYNSIIHRGALNEG